MLFYLLEAANKDNYECYPSIKKIAKFTDMGERTVQRHISALADRGLFERISQRRDDGSRQVNCYRFVISGTVKIGKESVVILGQDDNDESDQQPANNGGLINPPVLTPPPVQNDTTPRQEWRDIDQESEPGILTNPSPPDGGEIPNVEKDLFGNPIPLEIDEEPIELSVMRMWNEVASQYPGVSPCEVMNDKRKGWIRARAAEAEKSGMDPLEAWRRVIDSIHTSEFLRGERPPRPGDKGKFKNTINFMSRPDQFARALEGGNDDRERLDQRTHNIETGREFGPAERSGRKVIAKLLNRGGPSGEGPIRNRQGAPALPHG